MAKPSHLAFRIAARCALRRGDRLAEQRLAPQMGQELREADGLHRRQVRIETAGGERCRLGERTGLDHPREAHIAGGIKLVPRRREQYCAKAITLRPTWPLLPYPQCYASSPNHLKGADQPLLVSGKETPCSHPVELCQPLAKPDTAQSAMKSDRFLSDLLGNFRYRREPLYQNAKVKAGASDKNREAAGICSCRDLIERKCAPLRGGPTLGSIEKAIEPVWHSLLGSLVGTRGQDAEIAIALQAVGVNDDAS